MGKLIYYRLLFVMLMACTLTAADAQRVAPVAYSSTAPINYVRTWDAKVPQTDANKILRSATVDSFLMTTQYLDGLGRPIQTVVKQMSPLGKDIVMPVVYDEFGREQFKYLSFAANNTGGNSSISDGLFKLNPFQQDSTFSKAQYVGENYYYAQTFFESSPINRQLESFAPGDSWVGTASQSNANNRRSVKTDYQINTVSDSVRIWTVAATVSIVPTTTAIYGAGELFKTIVTDEHLKQITEYKDKEGKVLLKKVQLAGTPGSAHVGWLCTYYVYDDFNNLRFVLQPKAIESLLLAGSWTISNTVRDELCFYYGYDVRQRMTIKKVPGAGEVYMIYDARDRLVMTQDANLRGNSQWLITLYDGLNRPVQTGLVNNSSIGSKSLATHQTDAGSSTAYPFSQYNLPGTGYELLTQAGYDHYDSIPDGAPTGSLVTTYITSTNFITAYNASPNYAQQINQSYQTRGMPTWTKTKVLGTSSTYLYGVNIYDENTRLVQVKATNISAGVDTLTTQYDFSGKVLRTHVAHAKSGTNAHRYYVLSKNIYDAGGRLVSVSKRVNLDNSANTTDKIIAQNSYNESGQLKKKIIGDNLDSLEYDYNIRGWMLGANRDFAKSNSTSHYFGFDLGYDKTSLSPTGGSSIGNYVRAFYNGNIGGMLWKSTGDDEIRKYDFTYDSLNRLTGADFNQYTSSTFNKNASIDFSVSGLTYDANGNILSQKQRGWKVGGSVTIDSLLYNYETSSNKLKNVIDGLNDANTKLGDFRSSTLYMIALGAKTSTAADYNYDNNGNLVKDLNKDIVTFSGANGIAYNYLNLPQNITVKASGSANKGTIDYTYDAGGNKLKKITTEGSKITTTLYMLGNYINDTLQFLAHEEGRMRSKGDTGFVYDYFIKDHLGNVRMVLTEETKTDTYPAATMEAALSSTEDSLYSNLTLTRNGLPPGYPVDTSYSNPNEKVAKTSGSGNKIGPAIVLKVMAGDKFNVKVSSWYKMNGVTPNTPYSPVGDLINVLTSGIGSVSGSHGTSSELTSTGVLNPGILSYYSSHTGDSTTKPKAYLNWVLFDEQFKFVSNSSGFDQVGNDNTLTPHQFSNLPINKNGYLYVYVSNETPNINVYFDNLQVTHIRGPLLEETHYYPFGLTMAGISSKAAGKIENKRKYQHYEFNSDFDINLYESFYRSHDPQLGRFWQIDPKPSYFESPYAAMGNNPILNLDPLGDTTIVDKRGNVLKQYGTDKLIFLQKKDKLVGIGEFGKTIKGNVIIKNLLKASTKLAKTMDPLVFKNLVQKNGLWDFKNNQKTIYGLAASFDAKNGTSTKFEFDGNKMDAVEFGNYHYGVAGKATFWAGEEMLLRQAGKAQMNDGSSNPEWQKYKERKFFYQSGGYGTPQQITLRELIAPYGDDPHDQALIKEGFKYYDKNKQELKKEEEE